MRSSALIESWVIRVQYHVLLVCCIDQCVISGWYGSPSSSVCESDVNGNGVWRERTGCSLNVTYCSVTTPVTVGYNTSVCSSRSVDSECPVACSFGYSGTPSPSKCTVFSHGTGVWSALSGCAKSESYCPSFVNEVEGYRATTCANTNLGDDCGVLCAYGYEGVASPMSCTIHSTVGKWTAATGCALMPGYCIRNIPESPGYQAAVCDYQEPNSECGIQCAAGYEGLGCNVTCGTYNAMDGLWSIKSGCTIIENYCGDYTIPTGYVSNGTCLHSVGSKCDLRCADGYEGGAVLDPVCVAGPAWSSPSGCTLKLGACMLLFSHVIILLGGTFYPSSEYVVTGVCDSHEVNDVCDIGCSFGYTGNPPDVQCQVNEQWYA